MQALEQEDYFGPDHRFVKELSPSDFDEGAPWQLKPRTDPTTGEKIPSSGMVLFYAPWCGFCKKVKQSWIDAAKLSGFCDFYAFNCEKHKSHLSKIKSDMPQLVRGYPTIVLYKNGSPDEYYQGDRSAQGFVSTCMNLCKDGKCRSKMS